MLCHSHQTSPDPAASSPGQECPLEPASSQPEARFLMAEPPGIQRMGGRGSAPHSRWSFGPTRGIRLAAKAGKSGRKRTQGGQET